MLLAALVGCGSSSGPPCAPTELELSFEGTLTIDGGQSAVTLVDTYDATTESIGPDAFAWLVEILVEGLSTGGSSSAVFGLASSAGAASLELRLQLGGARANGFELPALGATTDDLLPGRGPPVSALPRSAFWVLFTAGDFQALTATGELVVIRAAPLSGTLSLSFTNADGEPATLTGTLTVRGIGPGC